MGDGPAVHPSMVGAPPAAVQQAEPEIPSPVAEPAPASDEVDDYFQERRIWDEAQRDMAEGRYPTAKSKFERLLNIKPDSTEYQASVAYTDFMLAPSDKMRWAALGKLRELGDKNKFCATTLFYQGLAHLKVNRPKGAVRLLKAAAEIDPGRRDIQDELARAQDIVSGKGGKSEAPKTSTMDSIRDSLKEMRERKSDEPKVKKPKTREKTEEIDAVRLGQSFGAFFVIAAFLYGAAVVAGMGAEEYFYDPGNAFFWIRRALLIVFGLGLSFVFVKETIDQTDFKPEPVYAVAAVLYGALVGYFSPTQAVKSGLVLVLVMTIIHVVAEEIFFRVFLARNLERALPGLVAPAVLGGLLYGMYHLTYYSFSANPAEVVAAAAKTAKSGDLINFSPEAAKATVGMNTTVDAVWWCGLIGAAAGIPYAILYHLTRTFTAPFLCHLAVNCTMMILSATS